MAGHGGARNRSGPQPDADSGRSDKRGLVLTALPPEGYAGEVPNFPLPRPLVREIALWRWAWSQPQAAAWANEPWRWQTVGMYVRWTVRAERRTETAAALTQATRLADQIGLTPAGLRENGWKIAPAEPDTAQRARATRQTPATRRSRFEVVRDGDGPGHPTA